MKHLFKTSYAIVGSLTVLVDLAQIVMFLVLKFKHQEPSNDRTFNILSTLSQYFLFVLNCMALKYFYQREDFLNYIRKTVRHEYLYLFLVIFLIRFCDLFFFKTHTAADKVAAILYLVGVFVKHFSRLVLLQVVCFYLFRSEDNVELLPAWKFLLYISPNLVDIIANLIRLTVYYVFVMYDNSSTPLTKAQALIFLGEMLYYYYNTLLISGFLLKLKNPNKDVLRFFHKDANQALHAKMDMFAVSDA